MDTRKLQRFKIDGLEKELNSEISKVTRPLNSGGKIPD